VADTLRIQFTGCTLTKIERDRKIGKAHFDANLSDKVVNTMNWKHPEDFETSVSLDGSLAGRTMVVGMKGTLADAYEIHIDILSVGNFQSTRRETKGKRGKGYRHTLSFIAKFVDAKALALLEDYLQRVPEEKGTCLVLYTAQPEQGELGDVTATPEQRQAVMEDVN
jgi:hypothetical protein